MEFSETERMARELMAAHGVADWAFGWNWRKRALGLCRYRERRLELSRHFVKANGEGDCAARRFLHETRMRLRGRKAGHGRAWKMVCALGSDGGLPEPVRQGGGGDGRAGGGAENVRLVERSIGVIAGPEPRGQILVPGMWARKRGDSVFHAAGGVREAGSGRPESLRRGPFNPRRGDGCRSWNRIRRIQKFRPHLEKPRPLCRRMPHLA